MFFIDVLQQESLSLAPHRPSFVLNRTLSLTPLSAVSPQMRMENGAMFLKTPGEMRLLDVRLAYGHKEGGGRSSHHRSPNCRKETSLCSWPRPEPDVAICSAIVSSNVGIWVWMMAFSLAKTFLRRSGGNTLFFLCWFDGTPFVF